MPRWGQRSTERKPRRSPSSRRHQMVDGLNRPDILGEAAGKMWTEPLALLCLAQTRDGSQLLMTAVTMGTWLRA